LTLRGASIAHGSLSRSESVVRSQNSVS
jgi:hypothetical protein